MAQVYCYNCWTRAFHHAVLIVAASGSGDYGLLSTWITFPNGSTDGAENCTSVTVYPDKLVELEENFTVVIDLITTGANLNVGNNISSITLLDDDGV